MSSKLPAPKTAWDYGFKVWLISLAAPFFVNTIRYFIYYSKVIQYQLLFNFITLIAAIPFSVFPLLVFSYTVKKANNFQANIILKKLFLSLSYLFCLILSIAIPVLCICRGNDFLDAIFNVLYLGLGLNILFGLAALWVLRIRID